MWVPWRSPERRGDLAGTGPHMGKHMRPRPEGHAPAMGGWASGLLEVSNGRCRSSIGRASANADQAKQRFNFARARN